MVTVKELMGKLEKLDPEKQVMMKVYQSYQEKIDELEDVEETEDYVVLL